MSAFRILQFGLCCFTYDGFSQSYIATPFQFPLFPADLTTLNRNLTPSKRKRLSDVHEDQFQISPSSVRFLLSVNFDFTRVYEDGIGWLNYEQENYAREIFDMPLCGEKVSEVEKGNAEDIVTRLLKARGNGRDLEDSVLYDTLIDIHSQIMAFTTQHDLPITIIPINSKHHKVHAMNLIKEMFETPPIVAHFMPTSQLTTTNKYYNKLIEAGIEIRVGKVGCLEIRKMTNEEMSTAKLLSQAKMAVSSALINQ